MRSWQLIMSIYFFLSTGCKNSGVYEELSRRADSLRIAADFLGKQIVLTDTTEISKSLKAYKRYTGFFSLRARDTLDQNSARYMNEYANSCSTLSICTSNRKVLSSRLNVLMPQLAQLSADAKNHAADAEKMQAWLVQEQEEWQRISEGWSKVRELEAGALGGCRRTQPEVETIVRSLNEGRLPELIE